MAPFMVAAGPDFRSGHTSSVPSGHQDINPTIRHLLGLEGDSCVQGRVLLEALRDGVSQDECTLETESVIGVDRPGATRLQRTTVNRVRYVDYIDTIGDKQPPC